MKTLPSITSGYNNKHAYSSINDVYIVSETD